jgi:hypothetical protein
MESQTEMTTAHANLPRELRAVLHLFNYDRQLEAKALPHVNVERQFINWPAIWSNDFSGGHSAAIVWAKALWTDHVERKSDPFDQAFAMEPRLQAAVIEALAIRWGLEP